MKPRFGYYFTYTGFSFEDFTHTLQDSYPIYQKSVNGIGNYSLDKTFWRVTLTPTPLPLPKPNLCDGDLCDSSNKVPLHFGEMKVWKSHMGTIIVKTNMFLDISNNVYA